jgi:hypothetical protein
MDADRNAIEALKQSPPRGIRSVNYEIRRVISRSAVENARTAVYRELVDSARREAETLAVKGGFRTGPILALSESLSGGSTAVAARFGFTELHLRGVNTRGLLNTRPPSRRFQFARELPGIDHAALHRTAREIRELPGVASLVLRTTLEESPTPPEARRAADSLLIEQARHNAKAIGAAAGLHPGYLRTLAQVESERLLSAYTLLLGFPREGLITDRTARKLVVGFTIE